MVLIGRQNMKLLYRFPYIRLQLFTSIITVLITCTVPIQTSYSVHIFIVQYFYRALYMYADRYTALHIVLTRFVSTAR